MYCDVNKEIKTENSLRVVVPDIHGHIFVPLSDKLWRGKGIPHTINSTWKHQIHTLKDLLE